MSTFTQLICLVEESQIGGLVWSRPEFNWLQRVYLQQNISLKLRNLSRKSAALIAILLRIPIQFGLKDDEFSLPVNKPGLKNHMHFRSGWTFYLVFKFIVLSCRFINNIPVNIFSLRHCMLLRLEIVEIEFIQNSDQRIYFGTFSRILYFSYRLQKTNKFTCSGHWSP